MKSLYFKLSLWSLATLIVCIAAFILTASALNRNFAVRGGPFGKTIQWHVDGAERALRSGGQAELQRYMAGLQAYFPENHFLVDRAGRDVLTGEDRSTLVNQALGSNIFPPVASGKLWIVRPTEDGAYRLLVQLDPPVNTSNSLPYLMAVLGAISLFSYALFRYLVSPLRTLSRAVRRFGQGDFSARAEIRRGDEFGEVAAQFNEMASRIETLMAAERRLLEDVSHELRSPLARMQFALELVRTTPDRELAVQKMRREIDRLSELVGQLLEVTRAEGDPAARIRDKVDLTALASEIVEDCRIEAEAKQCRIHWEEPPAIRLIADHELLRRALENVLRNAIRYAPESSAIDVKLERNRDQARFVVRDYGPGVPDGLLSKIFEPFYRVDSSRTQGTGGVGLGLAIVKRAVGLHQGTVRAANERPGLRVELSLPLIEERG